VYDKTKDIFCVNPQFTYRVTYDFFDYANGNGNKVVITKGISNVFGGRPIVSWTGVNPQGYGIVTGLPLSPGSFVVDIVNGNDTGIYDDTRFYTRCTIPQLN
jgi:hypothetical protein